MIIRAAHRARTGHGLVVCAAGLLAAATAMAQETALAPRAVDIAAPDAVNLKATYFPAAKPGPAVLLLHMCNSDRTAWAPLGRQLAAAGIHALALDYRGYGESGGSRFDKLTPLERQKTIIEKWPGDIDAAFAYLRAQAGGDGVRMGAGGGSCGVNQAVQVARRHPDVVSLVLLAGPTNREGRAFLRLTAWLPVFASAAADDEYDRDAPQSMRWLTELSGNPRNRFVGFADGKHGTEMFGPHPELVRQIAEWFAETLVKDPADPKKAAPPRKTAASELWAAVDESGEGVDRAVQLFHEERQRDPKAFLFPEGAMNEAAYEYLQQGRTKDAVALFKLNAEAYPASANAQDSLGDGYLANGQADLALAAAQKALDLLPADAGNAQFKEAVRKSAQQKIDKIKAASPR
jgi:dienelactone hydrolase